VTFFSDYDDALDPAEVTDTTAIRPLDPGADCLPFDHLDDRRFEVMAYRLKCAEHGERARVVLMQGVGERGRDAVVYVAGRVSQIVQCKLLRERMRAPALRRELLKLALHALMEPSILDGGPVLYELWCPGGLTEPAGEIVGRWPLLWTEERLTEDAAEVLSEYAAFAPLTWEAAKPFVLQNFPRVLRIEGLGGAEITARVRGCLPVYDAYFQGKLVMAKADVEQSIRSLLIEAGGFAHLSDKDARYVLDRIASFPPEQRLAFPTGYVMGVAPKLVSRFNQTEYTQLATQVLQSTMGIINATMSACSRLAFEAGRDFQVAARPANANVVHVLVKTLTTSMLAQLTGIVFEGLKLQPGMAAYAELTLDQRLDHSVSETWDEYQRCRDGYDPARHAFGSDEEVRHRLALHALGGLSDRQEFEATLRTAIRLQAGAIEEAFTRYMTLVPKSLLVVTDTVTIFESEWLMRRQAETVARLVELRGSPIIPE
jgi:hypothetical protein